MMTFLSSRLAYQPATWGLVVVLLGAGLSHVLAAPAAAQKITLGSISGGRGQSVWFDATLDPQGKSIAGTQNDISFNSTNTPIATCTKNDQLPKDLSQNQLPEGCSGTVCTKVRALVFSTSDSTAILAPTVLYRCRVDIPATANPGSYSLVISNVSGSDPVGNSKAMTGVNGQVTVW